MGKLNIPGMITTLSKDKLRNDFISNNIEELYKEGREILFVSERREHCTVMKTLLEEKNIQDVGLFLGGMKNEELDESNKCRVILATRKMAEEGYDNPKLNTLILATSWSDIEQCVGRILRKIHKIDPLVIDVKDSKLKGPFCVFSGQARKRKTFFNRKFKIADEHRGEEEVELKMREDF